MEVVVFDFKGTLQVKNKKSGKATEKIENRARKLQKRAQYFYDVLVQRNINQDPMPSFQSFSEAFLEVKSSFDVSHPDCYSWSQVLDRACGQVGLPDVSQYYGFFLDETPSPLYEETLTLLQHIHEQNIPMVLLRNSNLSRASMNKMLEHLGIKEYFTTIITSGEAGFRKPDKRIFELCLKGLPAIPSDPKRILMVGNETEADISGAKSLGWTTVLICTTEKTSNGVADYDIQNLSELEPIIFPQ